MVRVFPKSANQPNEITLTICTSISRNCFRLMRDWKLESLANPPFRSERKKRSTSEGIPGADTGGVDRVDIHPPFFSKKKFEMSLYLK